MDVWLFLFVCLLFFVFFFFQFVERSRKCYLWVMRAGILGGRLWWRAFNIANLIRHSKDSHINNISYWYWGTGVHVYLILCLAAQSLCYFILASGFDLIKLLESTTNLCLPCILFCFFQCDFHGLRCFSEAFSVQHWKKKNILKYIFLQYLNDPSGNCLPG